MYYLIGAGLIFIISIIVFISARKKEKLTIQEAAEKYRKQIGQITDNEYQKYQQLIKYKEELNEECHSLEKQRQTEQDRAQEAHDAAERVLLAEHERARAELNGVKELELEKMRNEMQEKQRALNAEYNTQELYCQKNFATTLEFYQEELSAAKSELDEFQAKRAAVNEAIRREKELNEQESFYSIDVPEADREDIQVLQSMDARLHNRDVIPKLIWELFIRRPTQEMVKRVTGGRKFGGIYKITYKKTGEAYIGKSTDISTRWQNHIKTVIGLEGAARATLHARMARDGLWNYTFEVLEELNKDELSAREAYYINLYGTKNQLNMKSGDKNV